MANQDNNEISIILKVPDENLLIRSQSFIWKICHGTNYMLGGLFLIAGSCLCFPLMIRRYSIALTASGLFFSIGSFFLLFADLQEWWYNRIGCCCDEKYRNVYTKSKNNSFQCIDSSKRNRLQRIKIGINSFIGVCGSAFYLVGSILLIPIFDQYTVIGIYFIMIGSTIIFLSSIWKINRTVHINTMDLYDNSFRLKNLFNDILTLIIDILSGFGGIFYFIGVMLCLPDFIINDFRMNLSAFLCVCGGTCFFLASIFLHYRYHFKK